MTLNEWIRAGGNMLSDWCSAILCRSYSEKVGGHITIRHIRNLPLAEIFRLDDSGNGSGSLARREIARFAKENSDQLKDGALEQVRCELAHDLDRKNSENTPC